MAKVTVDETQLNDLPSLEELEKYGNVTVSSEMKSVPIEKIRVNIVGKNNKENDKPTIVKSTVESNIVRVDVPIDSIDQVELRHGRITDSTPRYDGESEYKIYYGDKKVKSIEYNPENMITIDTLGFLNKVYTEYHQTPESIVTNINSFFNIHNLPYEVKRKED